ncbi:MAG: LacI family DNA-binding transcriptional regulator [Opitutales bacterium]|nr:LacI family DNA-binding transcriptional regulator [Opitutales bacterium]
MAKTSIREIARSLGLSHTTVSEALRNNPRVREETRIRVQEAANKAGYNYNPLAGALMSEMRRSGTGTFRGVVAIVDLESSSHRPVNAQNYHRALAEGATDAAAKLGFKVEAFILGRDNLSIGRLNTILKSRGIHGIFLLPAGQTPDISDLEWSQFAGIYSDYLIERPSLDTVCSDHFRSMIMALRELASMGYRRPGLVLQRSHDSRLMYHWEAAFNIYQRHHKDFEEIQPFVAEPLEATSFRKWFKSHNPDVVLSHNSDVRDWMMEAGALVPETHGFCCLNVMMSKVPAAGLDLRPRILGSRAMELLIGQLHRNAFGIPETASNTTIPAKWQPGPTLVMQKPLKAAKAKANPIPKSASV